MLTIPKLEPQTLRSQFPALQRTVEGQPAVFLDGPGGTQSPERVIDAMAGYLRHGSSNLGGPFLTSREADAAADAARAAMMDMLNARQPEEIVFGQNMTSLTFSMSRALAAEWQPGDEIIVTRLDHDANISPWLRAAEDRGVTVRWLDFQPEDCTLALGTLPNLLNERTRLVAVNYASNAVGTISDVRKVAEMAHTAGALVYVDAVHYAPHDVVDVQALDCDFLACSVYKFFGPHTGVLYGKYEHLDRLRAYKVRPASDEPPHKWETGTQSFESLAGVTAAVDYLAALGSPEGSRRERLVRGMKAIKQHEADLSERFLREATQVPGLRVYGITDVEELARRTPTFAVSLAGHSPEAVATYLGDRGIFVWHGHYYAIAVMERLGVLESGGLVRIGFTHYNTEDELSRLITTLRELAS
ncbi:MAG: cysteine desulfurase-like protein [Anaerolineae bacterium]|uniref:cysteine desulfurase-like protein n=1 Tax=Promineifilum sp. TaxID=2664178 RepID=UPI001DDD99BF|nr:cysteine desulfurase-like protein [Anaerolineales bacterium]MCO5180254.1 cysteine desulfurase-like protein [Promineifilum sp.]MCW5846094.1 cysteine desulfurase-like protein [Anaerolineae bacterium]